MTHHADHPHPRQLQRLRQQRAQQQRSQQERLARLQQELRPAEHDPFAWPEPAAVSRSQQQPLAPARRARPVMSRPPNQARRSAVTGDQGSGGDWSAWVLAAIVGAALIGFVIYRDQPQPLRPAIAPLTSTTSDTGIVGAQPSIAVESPAETAPTQPQQLPQPSQETSQPPALAPDALATTRQPDTRPPATEPPATVSLTSAAATATTRPRYLEGEGDAGRTTQPPATTPVTTTPVTTRLPVTTRPPATTRAPTTRPPTTRLPVTAAPTTRPPVTQPPTTQPPTTRRATTTTKRYLAGEGDAGRTTTTYNPPPSIGGGPR